MRPNILTLLLAFFTVTIATAQLYDNRARYLRTPHDVDRFERTIYQQRKPIKSTYRSTPTRSSSYSNYRSRISKYARPSYDSREFYYNFRDPSVLNRYANNAVKSEFDLTDCHCNIRFDVDQAFRQWYRNQQLVRGALLRGYETLFEKKIENLLNKQFPDFKTAQKEFFKEYGKISQSDYIKEVSNITSYDLNQHQLEFGKAKSYYKFFDYVKTQNDIYSRQPVNIRRVDLVGDLVINGQLVRRPSRWRGPSRLMYNTSNLNTLFNDMKNSYRQFLISKKIYDGLNGNFSFFYDYLSEKYVEHYNSQSNYEYKLGAFNGYIEHYQNQAGYGIKIPTHNYSRHMLFKVPTNGNELRAFFKKNLAKNIDYTYRGSLPTIETAIANVALYELDEFTSRELSEISYNSLKDKDRKKRLYGKIKEAVLNKSVLRNAVKQYFKNAIPIYDYSIQSVKDAVGSRLENKPFMWSELDKMPYFKFQNAAKPEVLFTLDLKVRLERKRQRFPAPEFYRYKGIADVLKYIYNVEKYWGVEGATIRHFLKEKGLNVPSSLSNRDLGTLFDFGGGNTNTLTIEFSDYAKKYITNFHHGDGIYGTSLFTDPFKLQALKEILKGNKVDFDDRIFNELTGKAKCVYDRLENLDLFKKTIKKFDDIESYNLILTTKGSCVGGGSGCTSFDERTNTATIKIIDTKQPSLDLAATILHEGIHADIYKFVSQHEKGKVNPDDRPRLMQLYFYYKKLADSKIIDPRHFNTIYQHEHMAEKYIKPIAQAIRQLDGNRFNIDHYYWFAWEGLEKTYLFKSKLTESKKKEYKRNKSRVNDTTNFKCN